MPYATDQLLKYADVVSANPDLRQKVFSTRVIREAARKNALREFIGAEESGAVIIKKRDLTKGGSDTVVFTTVSSVGGQGVLGENRLTGSTQKLRFGTFGVVVDVLRHAVSATQVMKMFGPGGRSLDQVGSARMGEWLGKKEEDDFQIALRRAGLLGNATYPGLDAASQTSNLNNLYICGGKATLAELVSADTLQTTDLELAQGLVVSLGGKPIRIDRDVSGADIPRHLFIGPDQFLRPLRTSQTYMAALREADARGKDNRLFSGKYADWNNIIVYPHYVARDTSLGRQGSPWAPRAYLGTALADGTPTTLTGQDPTNLLADYFANFPGYLWKMTDNETPPTDSGPHYLCIYNLSGANKGKYEIVKYTTGNNGNTITSVTRGVTNDQANDPGNYRANAASKFSLAHPSGSLMFPCTVQGVPLFFGAMCGQEALFYATGVDEGALIEDYEDFRKVGGGEPHIKSIGIQTVRGVSPYKDSNRNLPNFIMVAGAGKVPEAPGLVPYAP